MIKSLGHPGAIERSWEFQDKIVSFLKAQLDLNKENRLEGMWVGGMKIFKKMLEMKLIFAREKINFTCEGKGQTLVMLP